MAANAKKSIIVTLVGAAAAVGIGYFAYEQYFYVSTDDAQVGAHVTMLSSRVPGVILQVLVDENQKVKAGQVLAQIDTSDLSNASEAAQAEMTSLQAKFRESETNYRRAIDLFHRQAIARERLDAATATYRSDQAKLEQAKAQFSQAQLNVKYTKVIAPTDGMISRKSTEVGQYIAGGQPLFGFVSGGERWVTANFKETEMPGITIGKHVHIAVDAIPHHAFEGEVESISPSTGAVFSLLPPDNSTGNFTKVVQRVPVKIALKNLTSEEEDLLRAGLSADVSIKVR